jgi:type I restriction enzyme R subunit
MHEQFRRRRLPHWDVPGATYFVTSCLAGSIPAQGLLEVREFQERLLATRPHDRSPEWLDLVWKKTFVQRERWLDTDSAVRHLERPELATIVVNSLRHFADIRYELIGFVVMPSHFHWLFRPLPDWEETVPKDKTGREVIMHSIQSYTAHECNRILGLTGAFWQGESFDHCVRDEGELERILDYIELNPVKARLCAYREEWPYSSAYKGKEMV